MHIVRIFFTKQNEAAYISHLDLQRVMARALRRSGLPVWYSKGFNPHIYMSFALPLPLMHHSFAETVDCKSEEDPQDYSPFIAPLNSALPKGIEVTHIALPVHKADAITEAEYHIYYPDATLLAEAVAAYNAAPAAPVVRRTKRSEEEIDLKMVLPGVNLDGGDAIFRLPAGNNGHYSPALFTEYLAAHGMPGQPLITRTAVFIAGGAPFS